MPEGKQPVQDGEGAEGIRPCSSVGWDESWLQGWGVVRARSGWSAMRVLFWEGRKSGGGQGCEQGEQAGFLITTSLVAPVYLSGQLSSSSDLCVISDPSLCVHAAPIWCQAPRLFMRAMCGAWTASLLGTLNW